MSPQEIQRLLTDACPELGWAVDGEKVRAEGVAITACDGGMDSTMLRIANARGVRKLWREDRHSDAVAATVWSLLTADEIATCPGAACFVARMTLRRIRARVAGCAADREIAEQGIVAATLALQEAEADLADAQAALAAAEAHAAKVGA